MSKQLLKNSKFKQFEEDFALFIEAGFIAVKQLDEISAVRIFEAAQLLSPTSSAPQIGLGYIALNKLETKKAIEIFEKIHEKEPENYVAQAFLGLSYMLVKAKRKKGEKLMEDAMAKSDDPTIHNLAKIALEWSEKELSKAKSPFFGKDDDTGEDVKPKKPSRP